MAFDGVAADGANKDLRLGQVLTCLDGIERLAVKAVMYLLYCKSISERRNGRFIAFGLGFCKELGIHLLELMAFAIDGRLEIGLRILDAPHHTEMCMRMNGLCFGRRTKQLRNLRIPILVGLLCKGQVLAIRLTFAGECLFEILTR